MYDYRHSVPRRGTGAQGTKSIANSTTFVALPRKGKGARVPGRHIGQELVIRWRRSRVLRQFLRSAKGRVSRAAVRRGTPQTKSGTRRPVLREFPSITVLYMLGRQQLGRREGILGDMAAPDSASEQSPEEIHRLDAAAVVQHRPVAARYDGAARLLCFHVVAITSRATGACSVISTAEKPRVGRCRVALRESGAAFRCASSLTWHR